MNWYSNFLKLSRHWWIIGLFLIVTAIAFFALYSLNSEFAGLTAVSPYDTEDGLSAEKILEQVPLYQGEALSIYQRFMAFDFVFSLAGALSIALIWALFLRHIRWSFTEKLLNYGFPLMPLLLTVCDYGENISFLSAINGNSALATAGVSFNQAKLTAFNIALWLTGLLLFMLILSLASRFIIKRRL